MGFESIGTEQFIANAAKGERVALSTVTTHVNNKDDEGREPADSDSEGGSFADFMAFLKAPSQKNIVSQKEMEALDNMVVSVKAVVPKEEQEPTKAVLSVEAVPVAVARQERHAEATPEPAAVEESASSEEEESSQESEWSSSDEEEEEDADSDYVGLVAAFPIAPTAAAAAAPAPSAAPALTNVAVEPWSIPTTAGALAAATESTAATESATTESTAAARSKQQAKKMDRSVSDETSVTSNLSHLHPDAPVAVEYFTKKAALDEARNTIEMRRLALENMSDAHRYFDEKTKEEVTRHAAEVKELLEAPRPAAVEYFTFKELEAQSKRRLAIEEAMAAPAAPAVQFFTEKARAEKERKDAELRALRENPPPPSVAGQHFEKVNEQRQEEIEAMMNQPAPPAIEYFTQKAREEKKRQELALKAANENPVETSMATRHFDMMEEKKAREIKEARERTREKMRMEPNTRPSIDWVALTKQEAPKVPSYYTVSPMPVASQ